MSNIWFTADTHFNHYNIIKYCNRPFSTGHEMNEFLIERWNERIKPTDIVYHLGDFAFWKKGDYSSILSRLNGRVFLIIGNHDKKSILKDPRFLLVTPLCTINIDNHPIVLCHYAMRTWDRSHHGSWHLYGHSHGRLEENKSLSMDVGVDARGYCPISLDEVKSYMEKKLEGINK